MNAPKAKILIVDDEQQNRKLLEMLLRPEGYLTQSAANGQEALASVAQSEIDLILLDIMMPGMDGFEVAKILKAEPATANIPIVMLTAQVDREARLAGLEAGAEEFLSKPIDRAELWLRIRNLLRLKALNDFLKGHKWSLEQQVLARTDDLQRFRTAMDATADAIMLVNRNTMRFVEVNATACAMLDYKREDLLQMGPQESSVTTREQHEHIYEAILAGDIASELYETKLRRRDGTVLDVEIRRGTHHFGSESIVVCVIRDISERKEAAQSLLRLSASLEQRISDRTADLEHAGADATAANLAKSGFLAAMSHEIRTPMNGVIGMAEVLQQTALSSHQMEMVDLIRDSANSLLKIIDDILDFSKVEAGKLEIERAPIFLTDIVEKACDMMNHLAEKNAVELNLFIDPSIAESVIGDALRIRQILINLVGNAIKFSSGREQEGKVLVRVTSAEKSRDRQVVEIQVVDNGIGMDEATMGRLFSAFSQADPSTTRRFGGTGLGLLISSHLVELMGGNFTLKSTPGMGSTFGVRLSFDIPQNQNNQVNDTSEVTGLQCLVIGNSNGLGEVVAQYLAYDGATVERISDLDSACLATSRLSPGLWIWVIADQEMGTLVDELRARTAEILHQNIRFVLIQRGARNEPQRKSFDMALVDGKVLTRRRISRAVAIASGRIFAQDASPLPSRELLGRVPPSREDALRVGQLILVAEDNKTNQTVILRQLALLGCVADIAENGHRALNLWRLGNYALLLTDLHMPEMDGYALAARIRLEEGKDSHIPIIALSANALKGEADRCRSAGMDAYLSKPLQLAELEATIVAWLPLAKSQVATPAEMQQHADIAPALDVAILEGFIGGDPSETLEFLACFRDDATRMAKELHEAFNAGEIHIVRKHAHTMKSSSYYVGALPLSALCAEIETTCSEAERATLPAMLNLFDNRLDEVFASIASIPVMQT
jgi:PAS domain S-box-containing protein